jgi:plasmid stabilization system protein ParE
MAQLIWRLRAISDLDRAYEMLNNWSANAVPKFTCELDRLIEDIANFPLHGAMVPEYEMPEIRERLLRNYRIIYRYQNDTVEIIRFWHAHSPLPDTPLS